MLISPVKSDMVRLTHIWVGSAVGNISLACGEREADKGARDHGASRKEAV